jgi:hypothetical protein
MATRIGTWAPDILLKSNYIEWIAGCNRFPGFLTPLAQPPLDHQGWSTRFSQKFVFGGSQTAMQLRILYKDDRLTFPLTHLDVTGFPRSGITGEV